MGLTHLVKLIGLRLTYIILYDDSNLTHEHKLSPLYWGEPKFEFTHLGYSKCLIWLKYKLNHVYITLVCPPIASRFLRVNVTRGLYHLVLEPSTTSRIRVTEGTTYEIEWAVVNASCAAW
jgi:hypothetical protein